MNYGIYFSEELQKQGARAVPNADVIKELLRRKDYMAIHKGLIPRNISRIDDIYATMPFAKRIKAMKYAIDDLDGYVVDLRGNTIPYAKGTTLSNLSRKAYYDRADILSGQFGANPRDAERYTKNIQEMHNIVNTL
jgi:hypothetical protein